MPMMVYMEFFGGLGASVPESRQSRGDWDSRRSGLATSGNCLKPQTPVIFQETKLSTVFGT
jgi:hypothetical protein